MKSYILRCIDCEDNTVLTRHKHIVQTGLKACVRKCVNTACNTYWAIYHQPNTTTEIQKRVDKP